MSHTCHAHGCKRLVPASMFACKLHWFGLSKEVRDAIWREYRDGQEVDKRPSFRYLAVQQYAVAMTAFKPHDEEAARVSGAHILRSELYRTMSIQAGLGDPLDGVAKNPPSMITADGVKKLLETSAV